MKEIYKVIYNKYRNEQGVPCHMQYTLGATGLVDNEWLTPVKITLAKEKIKVTFKELGIQHEFAYTNDVEIFRRDKIKEDAKEGTNRTD